MTHNEIISRLNNVHGSGNKVTARCPAHDDKQNSLSVSFQDGKTLLHCHAGCSVEKIVEVMGLCMGDLFSEQKIPPVGGSNRREIEKVYDYVDLDGKLIHQTIRYRGKQFSQRQPDPAKQGAWIYNLKNIEPVLYNLPAVANAIQNNNLIFICEGEKDCDNLKLKNIVATTSPMGAGKWRDSYSEMLTGAIVCIIPDNDEAGKKHAQAVAKSLYGKAKSIHICDLAKELPELPKGGDFSDFTATLGENASTRFKKVLDNAIKYQGEIIASWEKPLPFMDMELPPFPVEALPANLRNMVLAVSEATQTPIDMSAVAILAVISVCVQKKFKIQGKADWFEPLNIYASTIANPAERKSAVLALLSRPLYKYERQEKDRLHLEIERNATEKRLLEKEKDKFIAKGDRESALRVTEELNAFVEIKPFRLLADDITPEALISLMADNDGRMSVLSAEGGIFDILNGRYSNNGGVNIDALLKAHAAEPLRVDRKGRREEHIDEPALTIYLSVQPHVIQSLMSNITFLGRGLTARFLYSLPVSSVGGRRFETTPISIQVEKEYCDLCFDLLDYKNIEAPEIITLSQEAYVLSAAFASELEPRLIDDLEDIAFWAGKMHGAILRITGLLHVSDQPAVFAQSTPVSAKTMQSAITIGYYFLEHAKAAHNPQGDDKPTNEAKYILLRLKKHNLSRFNSGELLRLCKKFKSVDDLTQPIDILKEKGYLMEEVMQYTGTGRPPSNVYHVNPLFYEAN